MVERQNLLSGHDRAEQNAEERRTEVCQREAEAAKVDALFVAHEGPQANSEPMAGWGDEDTS